MGVDSDKIVIAVDGMGGDNAPHSVSDGIFNFIKSYAKSERRGSNLLFKIFCEECCCDHFRNLGSLSNLCSVEVIISGKSVDPTDPPIFALRNRRDSSMFLAVSAVKEGEADFVISSGNTGALMCISKVLLGMIENIIRPAIVKPVSDENGKVFVLLDIGANIACSDRVLVQFAIMGAAFFEALSFNGKGDSICDGYLGPSVGIINIGEEEIKGTEVIKSAAKLMKDSSLVNFQGYVEPDKILSGNFDVVVTDGFTGNVIIKVGQGVVSLLLKGIREVFNDSYISKLMALCLRKKISNKFSHISSDNLNGAMLLGLKGIVIKSHGASRSPGFSRAIEVGMNVYESGINNVVQERIANECRSDICVKVEDPA